MGGTFDGLHEGYLLLLSTSLLLTEEKLTIGLTTSIMHSGKEINNIIKNYDKRKNELLKILNNLTDVEIEI